MNSSRNYVAIAMSVYEQDKADNLDIAIKSILDQTYDLIDIYLQIDGYVTAEINSIISKYKKLECFHVEYYPDNLGLAFQLNRSMNKIINKNKYSFIARMDADDICLPNRIEKQVSFFQVNPSIAVLGTGVIEFNSKGEHFQKLMPEVHEILDRQFIKRCPFNHPSVMFNLSAFDLEHLKYDCSLKNTQDYYLWTELLYHGYKFANIKECLLYFRIDKNFHKRRGIKKSFNDVISRVYAMRKLNKFTLANLTHTFLLFLLRVSPSWLKVFAYKRLR